MDITSSYFSANSFLLFFTPTLPLDVTEKLSYSVLLWPSLWSKELSLLHRWICLGYPKQIFDATTEFFLKNISFQNDVVNKAPDQYYKAIQVSN
mmetsp:Transcript_17688/g.25066  ORF Transcript_17688/g.25066 Transcript_17688/m.25066 type:complete len:94 (+) Transcript_17688:97-378(+)